MRGVLTQLNPSDPGARMGFGGAYEWIIAIACCVTGIQTVPGGHSEKGFDLLQYGNNLQGLWSLKSSAQAKPAGEIRLKNKMSSVNSLKSNSQSYETPTMFIAPYLPGITYFDPATAPGYASRIEQNDEAFTSISHDKLHILINNEDFMLEAIKRNKNSLWYTSNLKEQKDFVLKAVAINGLSLEDASDVLRANADVIDVAIKQNPNAKMFAL
jgi:hypothetical protein